MRSHTHISMFGDTSCRCTEQEAINMDVVTRYRMAKVSERDQYWSEDFKRHRAGFLNIGELWGGRGMSDDTLSDKEIVILHLDAKGDTVWGIWRVLGRHTGEFYGIPATGESIDVVEVALWRLADGLITEAWYFGDDLAVLRQLGITPPI